MIVAVLALIGCRGGGEDRRVPQRPGIWPDGIDGQVPKLRTRLTQADDMVSAMFHDFFQDRDLSFYCEEAAGKSET